MRAVAAEVTKNAANQWESAVEGIQDYLRGAGCFTYSLQLLPGTEGRRRPPGERPRRRVPGDQAGYCTSSRPR